ncbi:MAG: TIGR02466 family protein [Alphaproteobacteria bacterium]
MSQKSEMQELPGVPLGEHTMMLFATPIVTYVWPDSDALNQALKDLILAAEKKEPGIAQSNVGGWHSENGFFGRDADCVRTLQDRVRRVAVEMTRTAIARPGRRFRAQYRVDGWANVMRSGNYHNVHNHPNNLWSGVYYVSAGEPEPERQQNGQLELLDPRLAANMVGIPASLFELRYTVSVKPGLMTVFPSWLSHLVHPFFGAGERISVAFNVLASGFRFLDDAPA